MTKLVHPNPARGRSLIQNGVLAEAGGVMRRRQRRLLTRVEVRLRCGGGVRLRGEVQGGRGRSEAARGQRRFVGARQVALVDYRLGSAKTEEKLFVI